MKKFIVYKVTFPNNKIYIGITSKSLEDRRKNHYSMRKVKKYKFYNALNKYLGKEIWEILEECENWNKACKKEIFYINNYSSNIDGYNSTSGGEGNFNPTEEVRLKMSISQTGKKFSKKRRSNMSKAKLGKKYGKRKNVYKTFRPFKVLNKNTDEIIGTWTNVTECARTLGTYTATVSRCLKYPNKYKSYKNYKFIFLVEGG